MCLSSACQKSSFFLKNCIYTFFFLIHEHASKHCYCIYTEQLKHLLFFFLKNYTDIIQTTAAAIIFCRILFLKSLGFNGSLAELFKNILT